MSAGAERFGDLDASRSVIDVVDLGPVSDGQAGRVEADRLRAAPDDEHASARPRPQVRDDGAPRVGEVVRRGGDPERIEPVRHGDEHVVGEGDADQVADHAAIGATRGPEPVGREDAILGRGAALGRQAAPAVLALAARDRPRHHDAITDREPADGITDRDHLGDALVPDRERARERQRPADVPDGRIDHPGLQAGLQRARDVAVNRECVAVAAADHERPDDRIPGCAQLRVRAFDPLEPAGRRSD